ncbi:hypothetical protein MD535_10480 [Vibrio sp. ZSDZ65]|uniref:Outer membrane protein beta-barrel domain-containing protein n=1 Tax=Vibrio qingdaonensis TaxID=2829491 RepID=A0A9X3CND9_9VIBR|nr:hypothetical protein [Vibrio qingdaonensis]MCW8346426.1 hypothetical protein [Vibrio qingdaonensis]
MNRARSNMIFGVALIAAVTFSAFAKDTEGKLSVLGGVSFLNSTKAYSLGVYQLNGQGKWGLGGGIEAGRIEENPDGGYYTQSDFYAARVVLTYGVTDQIYIAPNLGVIHSTLDRSYFYAGRDHVDHHTYTGVTPGVDFIVENEGWTGSVGVSQLPLVDRSETAFNFKVGWSF